METGAIGAMGVGQPVRGDHGCGSAQARRPTDILRCSPWIVLGFVGLRCRGYADRAAGHPCQASSRRPAAVVPRRSHPASPADDAPCAPDAPDRCHRFRTHRTCRTRRTHRTQLHPSHPTAPGSSLEDVVSRAIPAIVSIEAGQGRGSGFFVAPRTVITNRHVVQDNVSVTVRLSNGQALPGRVETASVRVRPRDRSRRQRAAVAGGACRSARSTTCGPDRK